MMMKAAEKGAVKILSGVFRERMETNRNYLMELDTQCLLQNFYLEAGIVMPGLQVVDHPETAKLHWGWEAPICQLRGHFLGHWLSAAAKLIAQERDGELSAKLTKIISELSRCQELNGGEWIGPFPEKYFGMLEREQYIWSPQYVMHKLIMGLMDSYVYAENKTAFLILEHLGDWYIRWTGRMAEKNPHAVYSGEEAGMLEVWARLYEITEDKKYMTLAERYSEAGIFKKLMDDKDALTNCHANASIPFAHGAAKMYEVTGDEKWLKILKQFWKHAVTDRGMYGTGGQNAGEFWVPPFMQGRFLGDNNQEFCTVYNMVRTASYLYQHTGEAQYGDYIERCLYNGFLAQQNPNTGTPAYFLPLGAGSRKKWGSKTRDFWCCHGTMVQAQTIYPELIYFREEDNIIINQYIPSRYETELEGSDITLEQTAGMKYYNDQAFFDEHDDGQMSRWLLRFRLSVTVPKKFVLRFRVPFWIKNEPEIQLDGESFHEVKIKNGYLEIEHEWKDNEVQIYFPNGLTAESLPDMPELAAILDGPIVLAGLSDRDVGLEGDFENPAGFMMPQYEHTYGTFPWRQNSYRTRNQRENLMFKPLYEVTDEVYTVYFTKK